MKKTFCRVILMTLACITLMAGEGRAQPTDLTNIPDLKEFKLPEDEFLAKTKLFNEVPFSDRFLAYSIRLPSDWTKFTLGGSQSLDTNRNLLGEVARYYGPPSLQVRSYFTIQATELGYDVTAKNWFLNYVMSRGYTLRGLKVVSDKRVEAAYILLEKDISYVVRAVAEINGSRMILAMYFIPESEWQKEGVIQAHCMTTFKFLSPEKARVESIHTYAFLDLMRFDYPSSWRLQAPSIMSIEAMNARIINANEKSVLNGQIDLHLVSTELDTTLPEEIKNVQKELDEKGLVIGKLIEQPTNMKLHDHIYFSRIEVYQANDKKKQLVDYEYWIGVMIENRYYYIVTMLTPARTSEFATWSRNSEAFKTVVESMRQ